MLTLEKAARESAQREAEFRNDQEVQKIKDEFQKKIRQQQLENDEKIKNELQRAEERMQSEITKNEERVMKKCRSEVMKSLENIMPLHSKGQIFKPSSPTADIKQLITDFTSQLINSQAQ